MHDLIDLIIVVSLAVTAIMFLGWKWKFFAATESYFKKTTCFFCWSFWVSLVFFLITKVGAGAILGALCCATIVSYLLPRIILTNEKN